MPSLQPFVEWALPLMNDHSRGICSNWIKKTFLLFYPGRKSEYRGGPPLSQVLPGPMQAGAYTPTQLTSPLPLRYVPGVQNMMHTDLNETTGLSSLRGAVRKMRKRRCFQKKAGRPFQALSGVKKRALVLALKYYFS